MSFVLIPVSTADIFDTVAGVDERCAGVLECNFPNITQP